MDKGLDHVCNAGYRHIIMHASVWLISTTGLKITISGAPNDDFLLNLLKTLLRLSRIVWIREIHSKQCYKICSGLVAYYQSCILIRWATTRLYVTSDVMIKGTVSRYCARTKLWFLDRMSRNQKMWGEYENLEKSVCITLGRVQYYIKTSQDYRSMIYCSRYVLIWAKSGFFGISFIAVGQRTKRREVLWCQSKVCFFCQLPYKHR